MEEDVEEENDGVGNWKELRRRRGGGGNTKKRE